MKRANWIRAVAVCLSIGLLGMITACSTVPVTGRQQLRLVPEPQMVQLGVADFNQLKRRLPINNDPAINARVQRVGRRIAAVASKDMPNAQWEFVVFDSKEANAFCLPGGKVGVYTGILPITKTDAGLATVIGHEVGHAVAHHGDERMSEALVIETGQQLLGSLLSHQKAQLQQAAMLAYGAGTELGRVLPHSRAQESEADHIGLIYMARAGYDPREAIAFWQRFMAYSQQQGGNKTPWFLRTHPVDQVRIEDMRKLLPEAEAAFAHSKFR